MFNIIPLVLILLSLSAIIIVVVRKFSILANLDLDSIQIEREARFKEQIIGNRIKRNWLRHYKKVEGVISPLFSWLGNFLKDRYKKVVEYKENNESLKKNVKVESEETIVDPVDKVFFEADECIRNEDLDGAEKIYIKLIGNDSQNIRAFKALGELYLTRKSYVEAKQTMEHAVKLSENSLSGNEDGFNEHQLAGMYFDLSVISKEIESYSESINYINKALSIEPNNPRYLDTKLDISIINKDKDSAWKVYKRLAEVNPENQKLEDIRKQIEEL